MKSQTPEATFLDGPDRARRISAMFGRISGRYDFMNTVITGGMHHVWRTMAVRLAGAAPAGPVLDVASGTGDLTIALARRTPPRPVVGVDFSLPMMRIAAAKSGRRRPGRKTRFVVGDGLRLPFGDETFAAVTVGWGLRNFVDVDAGLAELSRVLGPGGRLIVLDMTPRNGTGVISRLVGFFMERVVPVLGAATAGDREAYAYLPASVHGFPSADDLARRMAAVELTDVHYRRLGMGAVALHWGEKLGPFSGTSDTVRDRGEG